MAGNKRKLKATPESGKKSKVCEEESTHSTDLEKPIKIEYLDGQPLETAHDTSDLIEVSEDSGTQDDDSDWNPNMSQFFDAQLLVEEDEAFSDDGESNHEETPLQDQAVSTDCTITHEDMQYTVLQMPRYYCTVCSTSFSLQSNCLSHVDTMHPELSTSYQYVQDKISKVYRCGTCSKMLASLQNVHKHSSECSLSPSQSTASDDLKDDQRDKRSVYECQTCKKLLPMHTKYIHANVCANEQLLDNTEDEILIAAPQEDEDDDDYNYEEDDEEEDEEEYEDDEEEVFDETRYEIKEVGRFQCTKCKKNFKNHQSCISHLKLVHSKNQDPWDYIDATNIKIYICNICKKTFPSQELAAKHAHLCGVLKEKNERVMTMMHKCQVCNNYFPSLQHECTGKGDRTHSMVEKKMVQCPECERLFTRPDKYLSHFKAKHAQQGSCPSVELKMHTFGRCHICTSWNVQSSKELLVQHMLKHGLILSDINTEVVQETQNISSKIKNTTRKLQGELNLSKAGRDENGCTKQTETYTVEMRNVASCPVCNKVCSKTFVCINHIRMAHPQQNNMEEMCSNISKTPHKVYICHMCPVKEGKMFDCMSSLALHLLKHKTTLNDEEVAAQLIPDVTAQDSDNNLSNKTSLRKPKLTSLNATVCKTEKNPVDKHGIEARDVSMCPVCGQIFPKTSRTKKHIKKMHPKDNVENLCGSVTKILQPVYVCRVCQNKGGKLFHCITLLARHLLNHCITLSVQDFTAQLNIKRAVSQEITKANNKPDSPEKEYVITQNETHSIERKKLASCPLCDKVFTQACKCKDHIKTLHPQQDVELLCGEVNKKMQTIYICHVCPAKNGKLFCNMTLLTEHMLKHKIFLSDNSTSSKNNNTKSKKHQTGVAVQSCAKSNNKKNKSGKSIVKVEIKADKSHKKDKLNTKKKSEQEKDKTKTNIPKEQKLKSKKKPTVKKTATASQAKSSKVLSPLRKKGVVVLHKLKIESDQVTTNTKLKQKILSPKRASSKKLAVVLHKLQLSPGKQVSTFI